MKVPEFEAALGADANLKISDDPALLPEGIEDADWQRLASKQFLDGYSECDSIYDAV